MAVNSTIYKYCGRPIYDICFKEHRVSFYEQCQMYKAKKPYLKLRYGVGQKYCSRRALFLDYAGIRCPCCNYNLKYTSKNSRYKM